LSNNRRDSVGCLGFLYNAYIQYIAGKIYSYINFDTVGCLEVLKPKKEFHLSPYNN
jgi:hypothetical protein